MTDRLPDPTAAELASAHLDGATTADEAARVEADPQLRAAVAELAAVRQAVRGLEAPVDPARRDAAIAAAVAAFAAERRAPAVAPLAERRARRDRIGWAQGRSVRWLAVAAAAALVALAVPRLGGLDSEEDDSASSSLEATADDLGTAREESSAAATGGAGDDGVATDSFEAATSAPAGAGTGTVVALGDFTDVTELEAAVVDHMGASASGPEGVTSSTLSAPSAAAPCTEQVLAASAEDGPVVLVLEATATLAGEPVEVVVTERDDGRRRLHVLSGADCSLRRVSDLPAT